MGVSDQQQLPQLREEATRNLLPSFCKEGPVLPEASGKYGPVEGESLV